MNRNEAKKKRERKKLFKMFKKKVSYLNLKKMCVCVFCCVCVYRHSPGGMYPISSAAAAFRSPYPAGLQLPSASLPRYIYIYIQQRLLLLLPLLPPTYLLTTLLPSSSSFLILKRKKKYYDDDDDIYFFFSLLCVVFNFEKVWSSRVESSRVGVVAVLLGYIHLLTWDQIRFRLSDRLS